MRHHRHHDGTSATASSANEPVALHHGTPAVVDEHIEAVQRALQDKHYYWGEIDGIDGPQTKQAVGAFQKDHWLHVTGVADAKTLAALDVK
jgi:peptidoglycan hydrolase-like protein with peptidoglycan-binding domain